MKKIVLITCVLIFGHTLFPQGTIVFVNRGGVSTTAAPGRVYAPVYREDPNDATHRISGNTPAGVPPGNTFYNGAAYVAAGQGPTFIATLWGLNSNAAVGDPGNNNLLLLQNGTTTFGEATSGTSAGIVNEPGNPAAVPGVVDDSQRGTFQMRVWDSRNGTIATWDQVLLPENNDVLRGYSDIFIVPFGLGFPLSGAANPPPYLQGLQSFNLFVIPEPSVFALAAFAAACVFIFRFRRASGTQT